LITVEKLRDGHYAGNGLFARFRRWFRKHWDNERIPIALMILFVVLVVAAIATGVAAVDRSDIRKQHQQDVKRHHQEMLVQRSEQHALDFYNGLYKLSCEAAHGHAVIGQVHVHDLKQPYLCIK
jgi:hypothetical protein